MKPSEFDSMTWGDYARCVTGYKMRELTHMREYRNHLAAVTGQRATDIFELPGDFDHVPEPMTQEEMVAQANKLGYAHLLGLQGEC